MYRRNFLFRQYPDSCFTAGKPFTIEVPRPGKYKVTVTLKTETPLERVSIRTGSGNVAFMGSISAGVSRQTAIVNVGNSISHDRNRICQDRAITVTVTAKADCLNGLSVSEMSCPTIYIAGSTHDAIEPAFENTAETARTGQSLSHIPEDTYIRWEQMLTAYTDHKIAVSDHCRSGLTMESFRKEGHYAAINEYSRPGDFCFFQFDPTGQSIEDWKSGGNCRRQLARYIIECRDRLVYPVLFTPVACSNEKSSDDYGGQLWEQCLDAYREVSKMTATPVIELHKLSVTSYDAYVMAGSVAQEIARICKSYPERSYRFLAKCMSVSC